jgi:hypothetical protein
MAIIAVIECSCSCCTHLDLHPALQVVAQEVGSDGVHHVDVERPEGDRLLVVVVPGAPEAAGLVPDLLDERVVLDDDRVLDEGAGWRRAAVLVSFKKDV